MQVQFQQPRNIVLHWKTTENSQQKTHGVAFAEDLIRATNLVQDVLDELEAYWVSWLIGF